MDYVSKYTLERAYGDSGGGRKKMQRVKEIKLELDKQTKTTTSKTPTTTKISRPCGCPTSRSS